MPAPSRRMRRPAAESPAAPASRRLPARILAALLASLLLLAAHGPAAAHARGRGAAPPPRAAGAIRIPLPRQPLAFPTRALPEVLDVVFTGSKEARLRGTLFRPPDPQATIVVLHGLGARRVAYYPVALELAREGFAVLVYSMRAHGDSGGDYDLHAMVDDVSSAVGAAGRRDSLPVHLLGGSTGGMVGYLAAARDERIRSVALIAAPISFRDVACGDRFYRNLAYINRRRFPLPDWLSNLIVKIGVDSISESEARIERVSEYDDRKLVVYRFNPRGPLAADYEDLKLPRGTDFVHRSLTGPTLRDAVPDCPVFVVVGSGDEVTRTDSDEGIERYKAALPGALFHIVPADHRHRSYLTDDVKARVLDFFRGRH